MEIAIQYYTQKHWNDVGAVRKIDGTDCTAALGRSILDRAGDIARTSVLDIACGTGWLAQALARQGARVTAVDISPVILGRARKYSESVLTPDEYALIDYVACDCAHLPCRDEFCDLVVAAKTIWVFPDIGACLREWRRLVRPGGRILVQLWGSPRSCSLITAGTTALVDSVPGLKVPDGGVGPFDLRPRTLATILATAGFDDFSAARYRMRYTSTSADEYWTLFGSVAGTAYYAYATQAADDREQIDKAVWRATGGFGRNDSRRLALEWWIVTGVAN